MYFQKVSRKFGIKKNVWVADAKEGFVAAEIKASKGDQLIIVTEEGVEVCRFHLLSVSFLLCYILWKCAYNFFIFLYNLNRGE